jgi:hypothetical protein
MVHHVQPCPPDKTPQALAPEQQIKALQVQLKEASEKAQLFEAMLDVLRNARMLVPVRRAYRKTTDSHHRFCRHPNRLRGLACA